LSGSGPAFIYETLGALAEGGVVSGLPRKIADQLACQTVIGAVNTFLATGKTHHELKAMVASPGGTTIEGLAVLEEGGYFELLRDAVSAAAKKSKKLSSIYL
jgi:pyrroline-5-carboxylate reductase